MSDDTGSAADTPDEPSGEQVAALHAVRSLGRMAVYVDETMLSEHGYVPAVVYADEPGYRPLSGNGPASAPWYWGHDLAKAKALADKANEQLGLSHDDVREIRLSSIRAAGL